MEKIIFSGTFDPFTYGHLDIALRASKLCAELIILVLENKDKKTLFTIAEREKMIRTVIADQDKIRVDSWSGLLVDYCANNDVKTIIRGLRNELDYSYESTMALTNNMLLPDCETIFITTSPEYSYISSSAVRIIAGYRGDIDKMVPPPVAAAVKRKFAYI